LCYEHDLYYANEPENLKEADLAFAKQMSKQKGYKAGFMAGVVGAQGEMRAYVPKNRKQQPRYASKAELAAFSRTNAFSTQSGGQNTMPQVGVAAAYSNKIRNVPFKSKVSGAGQAEKNRIIGREYLGSVTSTANLALGTVILTGGVCPQSYSGTRMSIMSTLYEKYVINSWTLHYVPSVGSSTAGSAIMFVDPDVSDSLVGGNQGIQRAFSAGGTEFAFWQSADLNFKSDPKQQSLYTSDTLLAADYRLSRAGTWNVIASATTTAGAVTYGQLFVDYDITFMKPMLEFGSFGFNQMKAIVIAPTAAAPAGTGLTQDNSKNDFNMTWVASNKVTMPFKANTSFAFVFIISGTTAVGYAVTADAGTIGGTLFTVNAAATQGIYQGVYFPPAISPVNGFITFTFVPNFVTITGTDYFFNATRQTDFT
jgi:hypothetical protein